MGTTLDGVDIIHIRVDILRIVGIVHDSHLDGDALLFGLQVDHVVEQMGAVTVDILHKLLQSVLGVESLLLGLTLLIRTQVGKHDGDAGIQVCQLTHALSDGVVVVYRSGEDGWIGPELLTGTSQLCLTHHLDGV